MSYESTITFTLDTICPWTYLALLRLQRALTSFSSSKVTFTLRFAPYQLYPSSSSEGEDKYTWYLTEKYAGNKQTMEKYVAYMKTLFEAEDVEWTPYGVIANTLHAHRVVHVVQEGHGPDAALRFVASLYEAYFTRGEHPSSPGTLRSACAAAGLNEDEARGLVEDDCDEGMVDVKGVIREQVGNGVDSVPYVVFEGRRRDFTLVGAKEVGEYVKTMEQVAKEV